MRNLDITTLRSFVAVAETGGVTRAAGFLNLTQSAVSMQLKRLEELLGLNLLERANRRVTLTPSGEQLLSYARRMVDLNDDIMVRLTDTAYEGEIRLGVPHDIVYPVIPRVLQRFNAEYPRMKVHLASSYTLSLKEQFNRGDCDLILTTESGVGEGGETLQERPMCWIGAPRGNAWRARPLRLAFGRICTFRAGAIGALNGAGIDFEIAVESDSDRTIEATVSADLAITAMIEGTEPPHLERIDHGGGLPDIGEQSINLYAASGGAERGLAELSDMIRQGFETL